MAKIAIVQHAPVFLDRAATLDRATAAVAEAAAAGARLVVFPEAFVPGYPAWLWRLRPGPDMALTEQLHARLLAQAVDLGRDDLQPLQQAARQHEVTVVCGIDESDRAAGGDTLYNTVVIIGPDGALLNRHRKMMPTNPERMAWGFGDASGLKAVDTPVGRVGALLCWESYMPLARCAMYAQGVQLYVAPTYDSGERWLATMQHIAREGGCWVIGAGCAIRGRDLAAAMPPKAGLFDDNDEWINGGDSVVVAPGGKVVAGPLHEVQGMLFADIELERVGIARRSLDVVGHYARPDLFRLQVNTAPARPVHFGQE
ncbi:carbon-nitrogen hydrolase family protein [Aquincola sp. S2]|uniref:Carbon-nitrogen hydrolase family protein n=1 Tax=Pseudaquabacterium terrae TaxID=2732868 RepID=A0ABX2EFB7_9BURK|nr:carbon-nitrogen hydrolase family protein [Aquabacterium terrae]NRF67291.1 carbon-nitrogen hydrolase family protein [Aquabacterium terrae]